MEDSLIDGAIAEECDADAVPLLMLRRQRRAGRDADTGADDTVGAEYSVFGDTRVHRSTLAAAEPVAATEDFGEKAAGIGALGEAVRMAAVGARDGVVTPGGQTNAHSDGFHPRRRMSGASNEALLCV